MAKMPDKPFFIPHRGLVDEAEWNKYLAHKAKIEEEFPPSEETFPDFVKLTQRVKAMISRSKSKVEIREELKNDYTDDQIFLAFCSATLLLPRGFYEGYKKTMAKNKKD